MDLKLFGIVFAQVFVAELGDKTQLATFLFATERDASKLLVFGAAAGALVLSSALAVVLGGLVGEHVSPRLLRWVAGLSFIAIGVWTIARA